MSVATAPATFYHVEGAGDNYWRVRMPAKAIGAQVCSIPKDGGERQLTHPNLGTGFRWYMDGEEPVYPDHQGTAVWRVPTTTRVQHALAMQTFHGHRIVAEVDDNYIAKRNQNHRFATMADPAAPRRLLKNLAFMDGVICSTRWLRDLYWRKIRDLPGRKRHNVRIPEFYVAGNHVDPDDWPEPVPRQGPLRVGWMGSDSHLWDIKRIYGVLHYAATELGCDVHIVGFDPMWQPQSLTGIVPRHYFWRWSQQDVRGRKRGDVLGFPYAHTAWVNPKDYRRAALPLDVGFAPLDKTNFNRGKTDVKFLDYTLSGAVTIAQKGIVYDQTIRHGETGFLCRTPEEMAQTLERLVGDETLRQEVARSAADYIRSERLIGQHTHEWMEAVRG